MSKFKAAAIFSNDMLLQREKNICIFGQGEEAKEVKLIFQDEEYHTQVINECWKILLPPQKAATGCKMQILSEDNEITFTNIAIGEVWLAGGQSNMEYELQNATGGKEILQQDRDESIRFFYSNKMGYIDETFYEKEAKTKWSIFEKGNASTWSAVGYFFAKEIARKENVTVGIIGCNWGGTSASCWVSEETLKKDEDLRTYLEEYYKDLGDKSIQEQVTEYKEYEAFHAKWDKKCSKLYEENPDITWEEVEAILGKCQWPGPSNHVNPYRPNGLYETMLKRIAPYTLRGFLYYQGEQDDQKPAMYQKLLSTLIGKWRADWNDQTLPFLIVQLPMHRYKADPDWKNWPLIREAQMNTFLTVKNTGIAVILDCGEFNEIHPHDKKPVGERLAKQALYRVYGKIDANEAHGPIYKSYEVKKDKVILHFRYAKEGFLEKSKKSAFEIAGDDGNYVEAAYEIMGEDIVVSSPIVKEPTAVRYCWTNYGEVPLYGMNGIPLAPFRTLEDEYSMEIEKN